MRKVCPQTRGPFWVLDCSSCWQDLSFQEFKAFNHYWYFYFKDSNKETGDHSGEISTKQMNIILKRKDIISKTFQVYRHQRGLKMNRQLARLGNSHWLPGCACESIGPLWRVVWATHITNVHTFSEEMLLLGT